MNRKKVSFFIRTIIVNTLTTGLSLNACYVDLSMQEIERYTGKNIKFDYKYKAQEEHHNYVSFPINKCESGEGKYLVGGEKSNGCKFHIAFDFDAKNPKFCNEEYRVYQGKNLSMVKNEDVSKDFKSKDGDLGRDRRFLFEDKLFKKIDFKDTAELCSFLNIHPGKSISFSHHRLHENPLSYALINNGINGMPSLLALVEHEKKVKEYQNHLFSLIETGLPQELAVFLKTHQGYDIDFLCSGKTPIEYAVSLNNVEKVEILKEAGAQLDQGVHSLPLLLRALISENKKTINYLAQFNNYNDVDVDGIDINFRDSEFFWPPVYSEVKISPAMHEEFYKIFDQRIYKNCKPQDELSKAAGIGRIALMDRAFSKGACVNNYDIKDDVALNFACSKARIDAIAYLIKNGAQVNVQDKLKGRSALHWVVRMHKKARQKGARYMTSSELLPCSFLLMCAGADPKVKDQLGKSVGYWVEKLLVNDEEKRLLRTILNIPSFSREKRAALLADIYDFQVKELQEYIIREKISIPSSSGARYFWHRPECMRMKNAWVKKDKDNDTHKGVEFKDIYKAFV